MDTPEVEMGFLVVIEKASANFSGYLPDVPGCVTTGRTRVECAANMREALRGHLMELRLDGEPVPRPETTAEYVSL